MLPEDTLAKVAKAKNFATAEALVIAAVRRQALLDF